MIIKKGEILNGVPDILLQQSDRINRAIKEGFCYCYDSINSDVFKCVKSFVANPDGYYKVFLRGENRKLIKHYSNEMFQKQFYLCEACGKKSYIYFGEHEDIMSVVQKLDDDHRKSSTCNQPVSKLKLFRV